MQIAILNGVYTDNDGDFRASYPTNYVPVASATGISNGYLRPAPGIVEFGTGPGVGRGGINWNGVCYRVMGTKLVRIDVNGVDTIIGDVGGSDQVTMVYSFDYLAIASGKNLFLYNGSTLSRVTDADLGTVLDLTWVDGYFMTTDGEFLVVTDLNNPFSVNPTKYGSSEADPDPVKGLQNIRNEVYALNRHTVEIFDNVGGQGFPFQRIEGAQFERGTVGTHTACVYMEQLAFIGGGRNESIAVWIGINGSTQKLSTREIDKLLNKFTEEQLSKVVIEAKVHEDQQHLLIHLPDKTLVYDGPTSIKVGQPVWFILHSGKIGEFKYRARDLVRCYDKWLVTDTQSRKHGYLSDSIGSHYGDLVEWCFGTQIVYNESRGAIFHELELVALTGHVELGDDPSIYTEYSLDGETWSMPKRIKSGKEGERVKRLTWFQQGSMRNWRIQRFKGLSDTHLTFSRLEAQLEPLNV